MIINEIDAISSWNEIISELNRLLANYEQHITSKEELLDKLHSILTDVKLRKTLSTTSAKEAYYWDGLIMTIENIISDLL